GLADLRNRNDGNARTSTDCAYPDQPGVARHGGRPVWHSYDRDPGPGRRAGAGTGHRTRIRLAASPAGGVWPCTKRNRAAPTADAGATRRRGKTRTYAVGRVLAVGRARNSNTGILALARATFAAPRQCDDAAGRAVHDSLRFVSDCRPKPRDLA